MRVKHLALQGYKSFASKTEFVFPTGITAIVGPNGSGKSNVADAIRWVLGERSMSTLRARSTADMIFTGAENRSQSGMAEVSLTFDNSDGALPIEFSEVTITRRAYRSGENEYLINGAQVLLRDVTELLAEDGLSECTYTVVNQGLVDAALSLRADERRTLFEEAAGISLYRDQREKAVERLDKTKRNLERVYDIISEVTPRLDRLEREAERVEEHRRLSAHLERLQRTWYGHEWGRRQAALDRARQRASSLEASLEAQRQEASALSERLARLREREGELRVKLRDWHRQSTALHDRNDAAQREVAVAAERRRSLQARREELLDEIEPLSTQKEAQAQQVAQVQAQLQRLERQLADRDARLADLKQEWLAKREQAEQPGQKRHQEEELQARRAQVERLDEALGKIRTQAARLAGEQEALNRVQARWPAYGAAAQVLVQADVCGVLGPVAALIQVPPQWERAVEAALGADLYAVVVEEASTVDEARRILESAGGRLTLLPLDGLHAAAALPTGALPASDVVTCDQTVRPAVEAVLGGVALCDDLPAAREISPLLPPGSCCATAAGVVLRADGAISIGEAATEGVFADERARRELRSQVEKTRRQRQDLKAQRQTEAHRAAAFEARLKEMDQQAAAAREEAARAVQEALGKARTEVAVTHEALRRQQVALKRETTLLERLQSQSDARCRRADELDAEHADLIGRIEELNQGASRLEAELRDMRRRIQPAEEELEHLHGEQITLEENVQQAQDRLRDGEARSGRAQLEVERCQDELRLLARRIDEHLGLVELDLEDSVATQAPLPLRPLVSQLPVVEELPEGLKREKQLLEARLRRLGDINPNAPEEHSEVQKRHRFLTEQASDLEVASTRLRGGVAELDQLMASAFQDTFSAVAKRFSDTFTALFDGGTARLELTDPDDLLNTGVDILARPPGKPTQRLALLSGGERALTAAALLFALLHVSPTPFCVFDEVDAMLDEANVGRFRAHLEELAEQTQFIVITHNRGTIEVADTIYGVSMGANAASQVVSLKMD